jgi:HD-GYP domain-containing protein (c-di-GMP phosphodiesterase class II)
MRFSESLQESMIERFVQKTTVFSIEDKQLVRDQEFRENVKAKIGAIHKDLTKKGPFKKFLALLDKGGGDAHYLRQHIHLLCQVMAGLGTRLGWISEKSVDKLIYIAYLHDIRFAQHPHLARIQGKRDFLQIESTLNEEEKNAFLESPAYAAEIARQDLSSFPDAIKILLQQKELPDSSGFPHGISGAQIAPLSSLFIVSHYFVDYVIENPTWTVEEFIKIHKNLLRGNYFQKIMQALQES